MDDIPYKEIAKWFVLALLAALLACSMYLVDSKLSLLDLFLIMPPWGKIELFPDTTCFVHLSTVLNSILFFVVFNMFVFNWYTTEVKNVENMVENVKKEDATTTKCEETEKTLLDNTCCMIDQVDMEVMLLADAVAANNENPGRRVGGEVEWATGETSSEDEDATREVTGARVRKNSGDQETEELAQNVKRFLQHSADPHLDAYS